MGTHCKGAGALHALRRAAPCVHTHLCARVRPAVVPVQAPLWLCPAVVVGVYELVQRGGGHLRGQGCCASRQEGEYTGAAGPFEPACEHRGAPGLHRPCQVGALACLARRPELVVAEDDPVLLRVPANCAHPLAAADFEVVAVNVAARLRDGQRTRSAPLSAMPPAWRTSAACPPGKPLRTVPSCTASHLPHPQPSRTAPAASRPSRAARAGISEPARALCALHAAQGCRRVAAAAVLQRPRCARGAGAGHRHQRRACGTAQAGVLRGVHPAY